MLILSQTSTFLHQFLAQIWGALLRVRPRGRRTRHLGDGVEDGDPGSGTAQGSSAVLFLCVARAEHLHACILPPQGPLTTALTSSDSVLGVRFNRPAEACEEQPPPPTTGAGLSESRTSSTRPLPAAPLLLPSSTSVPTSWSSKKKNTFSPENFTLGGSVRRPIHQRGLTYDTEGRDNQGTMDLF